MSNRFETQFHHLTNTDEKGTISFRISIPWPSIRNHRLQREKLRGKIHLKYVKQKMYSFMKTCNYFFKHTDEDRTKEGGTKCKCQIM
jgi:hypothetical protein